MQFWSNWKTTINLVIPVRLTSIAKLASWWLYAFIDCLNLQLFGEQCLEEWDEAPFLDKMCKFVIIFNSTWPVEARAPFTLNCVYIYTYSDCFVLRRLHTLNAILIFLHKYCTLDHQDDCCFFRLQLWWSSYVYWPSVDNYTVRCIGWNAQMHWALFCYTLLSVICPKRSVTVTAYLIKFSCNYKKLSQCYMLVWCL